MFLNLTLGTILQLMLRASVQNVIANILRLHTIYILAHFFFSKTVILDLHKIKLISSVSFQTTVKTHMKIHVTSKKAF